eukprot:TRINITY_DN66213_c4_g12_i3.p1 TRINITY_DN66213_c4_g12~~TRINITY_DN66213_c4_g12_i3.p1  ORF type:complete len:137 (-),score=11.36 TRINITY_DN66213_c4_g12_i3:609-1019(-)
MKSLFLLCWIHFVFAEKVPVLDENDEVISMIESGFPGHVVVLNEHDEEVSASRLVRQEAEKVVKAVMEERQELHKVEGAVTALEAKPHPLRAVFSVVLTAAGALLPWWVVGKRATVGQCGFWAFAGGMAGLVVALY